MKISINVTELFQGEAVGGLGFGQWLGLTDGEKLTQRLAFIEDRAAALARMTYTADCGLPGNIIAEAARLQQTAGQALGAVDAGDYLTAASHALDAGKQVEALNKEMAVYAGLRIVLNLREGNSRGGRSPKRRKWAERAAECVNSWVELPDREEALEFDDLLVRVYRDGDELVAADIDDVDVEPKTIKRSTFEKRYLRRPRDSK